MLAFSSLQAAQGESSRREVLPSILLEIVCHNQVECIYYNTRYNKFFPMNRLAHYLEPNLGSRRKGPLLLELKKAETMPMMGMPSMMHSNGDLIVVST